MIAQTKPNCTFNRYRVNVRNKRNGKSIKTLKNCRSRTPKSNDQQVLHHLTKDRKVFFLISA